MKIFFIAILAIGLIIILNYLSPGQEEQEDAPANDKIGKVIANTVLQISEIDATVLARISDRLENSCARNKYGLTENECINAIRERKGFCTQDTALAFPGQISNTDRMQSVALYFVDCLFKKR